MSNTKRLPDLYGWPRRADGSINFKKPRSAGWISDDGVSINIKISAEVSGKNLRFYRRDIVESWKKK